jgi:hypothetical protein
MGAKTNAGPDTHATVTTDRFYQIRNLSTEFSSTLQYEVWRLLGCYTVWLL